jgi:AraC family transcriptional regulator, glycine betaine-responsive activator
MSIGVHDKEQQIEDSVNTERYGSISRVGFLLLLPNFSMIAFTNAVEPLRMANKLSGEELYSWNQLSIDDQPVAASNGLIVSPITPLTDLTQYDVLIVCGGIGIHDSSQEEVLHLLSRFASKRVLLGAICTGAYVLAKAGLLRGYKATVHWEKLHVVRELFPATNFTDDLYVIDRDRITCSGGTAPLDLMCNLISFKKGKVLSSRVAEQFILERIRDRNNLQRTPLLSHVGTDQVTLLTAAQLMEDNIETPRPLNRLCSELGISGRQLQRLFQQYLKTKPAQYYINLRLQRARDLLQQANMSILDVTMACGFMTTSHFCRSYRKQFGCPPGREMNRHGC